MIRKISSSRMGSERDHSHFCPKANHRIHFNDCMECTYLDKVSNKGVSYEVLCMFPTNRVQLVEFAPAAAVDKVNLPAYFGSDIFAINSHSYLEPKYDGARAILHFTNGHIYITGRRHNAEGLMSEFSDNVPHLKDMRYPSEWDGMILDSEMMVLDKGLSSTGNIPSGSLAATMSVVGAHPDTAIETQRLSGWAHVFVFDMPFSPGGIDLRKHSLSDRLARLDDLKIDQLSGYIQRVPTKVCSTREHRVDFYNQCIVDGMEGCVAKANVGYGSPYAWIKMKQSLTLDCLVTDFEYGKPGGKYEHLVGTLVCSVRDAQSGNLVQVTKVVPGSDVLRKTLTNQLENSKDIILEGILVEVEAQSWTKEGLLRHPRVLRFRHDKDSISIVNFREIERR